MSSIRELLVILSFLAIANARNNVKLATQLLEPFNQQDFQQISWKNFIGLENDWNNLQTPLSASSDTEINYFLTNVNKGYDNFNRATDNIVRMCRTVKSVLPVIEKDNKLKQYNEQVARQLNSFKQATDSLRAVKTNLEAAEHNLDSIDIKAEKLGFKKYVIQDFNNGTVKLEVDTGYANADLSKLLSFLSGQSYSQGQQVYFFNTPSKPTPYSADSSFETFEKRFNQVEKGVKSAVYTIQDVIQKEENIPENFNDEAVPTVDELHHFAAECDQFLNWSVQKHK